MKQKVIRSGNSTAVTIPSRFVKMIGVKVGDDVRVNTKPEVGKITYTFTGVHQLRLPRNPSTS